MAGDPLLFWRSRSVCSAPLVHGPVAVRLALEAVVRGREMSLEDGLLLEANHFGLLAATADMKEGLAAFLEKRPPRFAGR